MYSKAFVMAAAVGAASAATFTTSSPPAAFTTSSMPAASPPPTFTTSSPPPEGTASGTATASGVATTAAHACAQIAQSAAAGASASSAPIVDGDLAYECLNSVPLYQDRALKLLNGIMPYVEFQSDPSYLKNPPASPAYEEPAVDLTAEFSDLHNKLASKQFSSEYAFQAELFRIFNLAKDGHFRFFPDLLSGALSFSRNIALVSVSRDGHSLPEIFELNDARALAANKHAHVSSIKTINGQDASEFLNNWAQLGALGDPDANYNAVFWSKPFAASKPTWQGYFGGSGRFGYIWPGNSTTLAYKNGTTSEHKTTASVIGDFSGVTDGESMYKKFCMGDEAASSTGSAPAPTSSEGPAPTPTGLPGYPKPVIISSDSQISGYFLEDKANADVAVLSMLSFEPEIPSEFQRVLQQFLAKAKAAGKKKLVIDVSTNGGGIILNGYDAFRQLFPQIVQDGYTRYRNIEALRMMGEQFPNMFGEGFNPEESSDADLINLWESVPNYRYDYNLHNEPFKSPAEKFAIEKYNGDEYTPIFRWNLDDPLTTANTTFGMGMDITGYGSRKNFTQPFKSEDIVILYDGYCASTCTLFSEFMRTQAHVKSISIGGRPSTDPMTTLGGVRGANNWAYDYVNFLSAAAYESGSDEQKAQSNWTALAELTLYPFHRATDTSLNVRDNILPSNLKDGVPSQFVYEPADCRLFYEPSMITDVQKMWSAAASAAWGGKKCVNGGVKYAKRALSERAIRAHRMAEKAEERKDKLSMEKRGTAMVDAVGKPLPQIKPLTRDAFWGNRQGTKVPH